MSVVAFWSNGKEESAKTLSMVAISTYMAIKHNYRILTVSTRYNDDTLESCYWKKVQTLEYSREAVVWESNGFNF